MSNTKVEKTDEFQAVDENGVVHTICVYTKFTEHRPTSGPSQWKAGSIIHETQDGNHINVLQDGSLEDFETSKILKRL